MNIRLISMNHEGGVRGKGCKDSDALRLGWPGRSNLAKSVPDTHAPKVAGALGGEPAARALPPPGCVPPPGLWRAEGLPGASVVTEQG